MTICIRKIIFILTLTGYDNKYYNNIYSNNNWIL